MCSSSSYSLCSLINYLVCVAVFVPFLIFNGFLSSLFSSILTFTVLILSTVLLFTFTKQKPVLEENQVKDEVLINLPEMEEVVRELQPENEVVAPKKETQEVEVGQIHNYVLVKSPDLLSESESVELLSTSEDSDVDWPFQTDVGQIPACSDDSISDDDSLIEIALPEGHYISPKEEPNQKPQQPNLPEFSPESYFRQEGLMELLAEINEMNEEENLIEIDISMGSIKCSRLEIET